jgi:hypothetical protein
MPAAATNITGKITKILKRRPRMTPSAAAQSSITISVPPPGFCNEGVEIPRPNHLAKPDPKTILLLKFGKIEIVAMQHRIYLKKQ